MGGPSSGSASIVVANGPQWGQRIALHAGTATQIGRSPESQLPLVSDQRISKAHCSVEFRDGRFWLRDLQSRNGTWMRGQPIRQPVCLSHGDTFRCGSTEFAYWDPAASAPGSGNQEVRHSLEELLAAVAAGHRGVDLSQRVELEGRSETLGGTQPLLPAAASATLAPDAEEDPRGADGDPEIVTALQRMTLFKHMSGEQMCALASAAQRRSYLAGQTVIRQGDEGLCMYSIVSGEAEVVRTSSHDKSEQRLARLGPGDFFGELALFDSLPRSATVRAISPLSCLILSRWTITDAVRRDGDVALTLLQALSHRLRSAERLL